VAATKQDTDVRVTRKNSYSCQKEKDIAIHEPNKISHEHSESTQVNSKESIDSENLNFPCKLVVT